MSRRRRVIDPMASVQRGISLQNGAAYDWFAERGNLTHGQLPFRVFADTACGGGIELARIWHTPTSFTRPAADDAGEGLTVLIQVEGDATLTFPHSQLPLRAGSAALVPDGLPYNLSSDVAVVRVEIRLRRTAGLIPNRGAQVWTDSPYSRVLLATISAALSAPPIDPTGPAFAHLEVATGHLVAAITATPSSDATSPTEQNAPANLRRSEAALIARAKAVIERESTSPDFRVSDLAAQLRVSPAYLRRVFASVGTTPLKTIREARVRTALTLLGESAGMDIERVARLAGFRSVRRMRESITEQQKPTRPAETSLENRAQPSELSSGPASETGQLLVLELREAVAAQDWERAVSLIGSHWPVLLDNAGYLLDDSLRLIPLHAFAEDARAAAVRDIRLHSSADEADRMLGDVVLPGPQDFKKMDDIARSPKALNLLSVVSARMIALRVRGRMARATQLAELVERFARISVVHQPALLAPRIPAALLQAGIVRGLADDIPGAAIILRDAYERGPEGRAQYVQRDSAGKLALFYSLAGDMDQALVWLRRYDESPAEAGWLRTRIAFTAHIARSLVAIEANRRHDAEEALARLDHPINAEQSWGPVLTYARARYALAWGDKIEALHVLRRDRSRYSDWLEEGTTVKPLLTMMEVHLLLSSGRIHPAKQLLDADSDHPLLWVARAHIELAAGNHPAALRYATKAVNDGYSTRSRIEALAIQAAVETEQQSATPASSAKLWAHVEELARKKGLQIIRPGKSLFTDYQGVKGAQPPHEAPSASMGTTSVKLTPQQLMVLRGLEQGLTLRQIGARQYLSINTMKTHAIALYRRLGVTNRDEAIARAYVLGIL